MRRHVKQHTCGLSGSPFKTNKTKSQNTYRTVREVRTQAGHLMLSWIVLVWHSHDDGFVVVFKTISFTDTDKTLQKRYYVCHVLPNDPGAGSEVKTEETKSAVC